MKLPDFRQNDELNELRRKMGADLVPWDSDRLEWKGFETTDLQLSHIKPNPNTGTLEFNGSTVVVYIRDQYIRDTQVFFQDLNPEGLRRFHVADCSTLQQKRRENKYDERYVATNRTHGKFIVNALERSGHKPFKKEIECQLHVCRNCLSRLNYQEYCNVNRAQKNEIRNTFDLKEFFDKYISQITIRPKYSAETAPVNEYTEDWNQVSRRCREEAGWICEKCHAYLGKSHDRKFLHVHHIDGQKYNNVRANLEVLCIQCHAKTDMLVKSSRDYREYLRLKASQLR